MLSRRNFSTCAVLAMAGLAAGEVQAQAPSGLKRTVLQKQDFPDKYSTILVLIELEAGFDVARHTHPGVESSYMLAGELELSVKGQPTKTYKAGDGFQVPAETPHSGKVGSSPCKLIATYVVERDKPLASPAPA